MILDREALGAMLLQAAKLLDENTQYLSDIDSRFGDGDHGITMGKIAKLIQERVPQWGEDSIKDFLDSLGMAVMEVKGGSAGPLYGTMIGGLGVNLDDDASQVDEAGLKAMFAGCLSEMEDITTALSDKASTFPALCDEVERRLGKKLSANDLRSLYTLYDHLALPAEVVLMLVGWCTEEMERKYGPGRRPFLSQIKKEGFVWARQGIDTMERAEAHLQRLTHLRGREAQVLRLLDIPPHPLVSQERTYIAAWDDMGFDDEALRMAYEKTVLKKQSMDWGYMNGILRRWHQKGLHTAAAIQAGDRDPRPLRAGQPPQGAPADQEKRTRENMERMRRMLDQMKKEG